MWSDVWQIWLIGIKEWPYVAKAWIYNIHWNRGSNSGIQVKEAGIQYWFIKGLSLVTGLKMTPCSCTSGCTAARSCLCKRRHRQCTSKCHPSRTCSLQCSLQSPTSSKLSTTINANSTRIKSPKSPKARTWISLDGNDLLMEDKWLIESGKWMNDQIICAWQFLLQQKYPGVRGLHATVVVSKREFNSRFKEAWSCTSSQQWKQPLGYNINTWVFCWCCALAGQHALWTIISAKGDCITSAAMTKGPYPDKVLNVQLQSGGSDCGLLHWPT